MEIDSRICEVEIRDTTATFELGDGRRVVCPLDWFPLVELAPMAERRRFVIEDDGLAVNWPRLGERVTAESLLLYRIPKTKN